MTKTCKKCKETKDTNNFYTRKDTGRTRNHCKDCVKLKVLEYRKENPEKYTEGWKRNAKKRQEKDPLIRVKQWLKGNYSLTIEEYDKQLEFQGGSCGICGNVDKIRLAVDHCHKTGINRGILCHRCNKAIGMIYENTNTLVKMITYINNNGIWQK